jgi:hypothetical protein
MPGWPAMPPAADPLSGSRLALVVATSTYADLGLRRLRAPARDAEDLAQVLADPGIGGFTVTTVIDQSAHQIRLAVEDFLAGRGHRGPAAGLPVLPRAGGRPPSAVLRCHRHPQGPLGSDWGEADLGL